MLGQLQRAGDVVADALGDDPRRQQHACGRVGTQTIPSADHHQGFQALDLLLTRTPRRVRDGFRREVAHLVSAGPQERDGPDLEPVPPAVPRRRVHDHSEAAHALVSQDPGDETPSGSVLAAAESPARRGRCRPVVTTPGSAAVDARIRPRHQGVTIRPASTGRGPGLDQTCKVHHHHHRQGLGKVVFQQVSSSWTGRAGLRA